MLCIYCEENQTQNTLLCYGCQVDLFHLVSPYAICGICQTEIPYEESFCLVCRAKNSYSSGLQKPNRSNSLAYQRPQLFAVVAPERAAPDSLALVRQPNLGQRQELSLVKITRPKTAHQERSPAAPALQSEAEKKVAIAQARRFQLYIRLLIILFWITVIVLFGWWLKNWIDTLGT